MTVNQFYQQDYNKLEHPRPTHPIIDRLLDKKRLKNNNFISTPVTNALAETLPSFLFELE
jgi:hypothetical protein